MMICISATHSYIYIYVLYIYMYKNKLKYNHSLQIIYYKHQTFCWQILQAKVVIYDWQWEHIW